MCPPDYPKELIRQECEKGVYIVAQQVSTDTIEVLIPKSCEKTYRQLLRRITPALPKVKRLKVKII